MPPAKMVIYWPKPQFRFSGFSYIFILHSQGHTYEEMRVRHQGDIVGNIIEGTYKIIEDSQLTIESAQQLSAYFHCTKTYYY